MLNETGECSQRTLGGRYPDEGSLLALAPQADHPKTDFSPAEQPGSTDPDNRPNFLSQEENTVDACSDLASETTPTASEIEDALSRVTDWLANFRSQQLPKMLTYIVNEALAGREDRIIGYSIGVDVLGKPSAFDPSGDPSVRVLAGRLRDRLSNYYHTVGAIDPVEITIPTGRYVPKFSYRQSVRTRPVQPPPTVEAKPTIAIHNLANASGDSHTECFALSLTEEIAANLARFKDVTVLQLSTLPERIEGGSGLHQLKTEHGVRFVLEGSVRTSSEVVKLTIRVVDAHSNESILVEQATYQRAGKCTLLLQDEIAEFIAARLGCRFGPMRVHDARMLETKHQTPSVEVWLARYRRFKQHVQLAECLQIRRGLLEALKSDASNSSGWAALSSICLDEFLYTTHAGGNDELLRSARIHAEDAVRTNPENADAYQALARVHFHQGNFQHFEIAAERAIELNPCDSYGLAAIAIHYALIGQWATALELADKTTRYCPGHPSWFRFPRVLRELVDGDPGTAMSELKTGLPSGCFWYLALEICLLGHLGERDLAAKRVASLKRCHPEFLSTIDLQLELWWVKSPLADALATGWTKAGLNVTADGSQAVKVESRLVERFRRQACA